MKNRSFTVLIALAGLSIAAAGYALWQAGAARQNVTIDQTLFPDLIKQADDIMRIDISGDGQTITLQRQGKSWVLPQKTNEPADAARIAQLIAAMENLVLVERKTANPSRYADLKLGPPGKDKGDGTEVKLIDATGMILADAIVGKIAPSLGRVGGGFYARRTDQPASWLVQGMIDVPVGLADWAARKAPPHPPAPAKDSHK
jgi:hypothetical protein